MKILVAIPVYDGKHFVQGVKSLLDEQAVAFGSGDELQVKYLPSCSHPAMGRNQFAQEFVDSDFDRLVFVDADITFEPGSLIKLAHKPQDVVGGAYRFKFDAENYPIGWLDRPELWSDSDGLIEVSSLPGGFLALSKGAFQTFREFHGNRTYEHFGKNAYAYFQMPYAYDRLNGEDSFFCFEYRQAGGRVFLDPELSLTHWDGGKSYPGHIGRWLQSRILKAA